MPDADLALEARLESRPIGVALPAITGGLAMTVGVWCLWWLLHTPALSAPRSVSGPVLLVAMVGFAALACWWRAQPALSERMKFGGLIGFVSGLLNLMILGSMLTRPAAADGVLAVQAVADPTNVQHGIGALEPQLMLIMGCFVILCGVLGAVGGAASTLLPAPTAEHQASQTARHWLGRLGMVVAIVVLPLLLLGGLVTSANAGLSVPDWPGTFGSNMFLYPVSLMDSADPRIFKEHTHRLFGALVGVATLLQMIMIFRHDTRKGVIAWGVIAFGLVCVQGVLGGAWVVTVSKLLPVFHGVLGQIFFASMVALAIVLSPSLSPREKETWHQTAAFFCHSRCSHWHCNSASARRIDTCVANPAQTMRCCRTSFFRSSRLASWWPPESSPSKWASHWRLKRKKRRRADRRWKRALHLATTSRCWVSGCTA